MRGRGKATAGASAHGHGRARRAVIAMPRGRGPALLAALAACFCHAPATALAHAATTASMRASFLPDRLGATTAFTLAFRLYGGEAGIPAPLRRMVVHLPAGLGVNLRANRTCSAARLRGSGTAGCPSGSLIGRGHALLMVHAGSQAIPENATIAVFHGPSRGGHATLEILSRGETPLDESTISTAVLEPDGAPFGLKLNVSIPAIPTLVYEPDASFVSLSLTIGAPGRPKAHTAAAVTVPRRCPAGGFPFSSDFALGDGSSASARTSISCP